MSKNVCIIVTNQFIECPEVLDYAVKNEYIIYIPESVFMEINKTLAENVFDDDFISKIRKAKKIIDKNKGRYINAKSLISSPNFFADPKIIQYILEIMTDNSVDNLIIYTDDRALARDINQKICKLESIKHRCHIEAKSFRYENKNKPDNSRESVTRSPKRVTVIGNVDSMLVWRNNDCLDNSEGRYSTCIENTPVPTLSGNECVLKFWLHEALNKDWIKLYKDIKIKKGNKISINFMTLDNSCDLLIGLELYDSTGQKKQSSNFINGMKDGKWYTISMIANDDYDDVNFAIKVRINSQMNPDYNFNGTAGYIDSFTITE